MSEQYRPGPHSVFEIHRHLVGVTKYRRAVLRGAVGPRLRELIRQICGQDDVMIITGHVAPDHGHLFVSLPPQVTISRLVQRLKGRTAYKLLQEFPHLRKQCWGQHLWARGYFFCSSGHVTDEIIAQYMANQQMADDQEFRVEGEASPAAHPREDGDS